MIERAFKTIGDLADLPLFQRDWQSEARIASGRGITTGRRGGTTFDPEKDGKRLNKQHRDVLKFMEDG